MNARRRWELYLCVSLFLGAGCAKPRISPRPVPPLVLEASPVGIWESPIKEGRVMKMILSAGGRLTFEGGMQFYNPGQWDYNPFSKELIIRLPQADDEKLQVFKLSIGDGVKAFDRAGKRITYAFDHETSELNVGGWTYTRGSSSTAPPPVQVIPEPILR